MSPLPAVGRTALGVARVRAAESARAQPLFTDPYAAEFLAAAGSEPDGTAETAPTEEQRRWRAAIAFHIVMRTRFFDDYLTDAVAGGCEQVVLLGAGLDARAFRFDWPRELRWFEVDLPEVLTFKQSVLDSTGAEAGCDRRALVADLSGDWAAPLRDVGFRPTAPTAWLAEGLLVYLDSETAAHVLGTATTLSAPGSRLALERGDVATQVATTDTADRPDEASALWRGGLGHSPAVWLADRGWRTTEHETREIATSYGRQAPAAARSGFVTATR
jgi:methyltransferase (TIGR00027 family)